MMRMPVNFQAAAGRALGRGQQRPPGNSGFGHSQNPVHYMPPTPPPPMVNHMGFHGITAGPTTPQEQPSGPAAVSGLQNNLSPNQGATNIRSIVAGIQNNAGVQTPGGDQGNFGSVIQALNDKGIQASVNPHTGETGWAQYAPGLSVYEPQGGSELGSDVQGYLASVTDPYLAQQYKDQAANSLGTQQTPSDANYDSLKQAILATQQAKNFDTPGAIAAPPVVNSPDISSTPQVQQPVVQPPVIQSSIAEPVTQSAVAPVTNQQQFANRNLPGYSMGKQMGHRPAANRVLARGKGRGRR